MVKNFYLYQVIVSLYRSTKTCMPDTKVVQIFYRAFYYHNHFNSMAICNIGLQLIQADVLSTKPVLMIANCSLGPAG